MRILIILLALFIFLGIGCKKNASEEKNTYPGNSASLGKYTLKYKHLLKYNLGVGDSLRVESHLIYVGGFTQEDINEDRFFYTLLLQLCYCYLDTVYSKFPVTSLSFYDSMEGFPASKNVDDIGNIGKPFFEIGFDKQNPISLPLSISFSSSSSNNKTINMQTALENFHQRGCKDTWAGDVPKFAPLE